MSTEPTEPADRAIRPSTRPARRRTPRRRRARRRTQLVTAAVHAEHKSTGYYVVVALILAGLTALETSTYWVDFGPLFMPALLIMMTIKFFMVVLLFMHLKFDNRLFSVLFYAGLVLAVFVYIVALATFQLLRKLSVDRATRDDVRMLAAGVPGPVEVPGAPRGVGAGRVPRRRVRLHRARPRARPRSDRASRRSRSARSAAFVAAIALLWFAADWPMHDIGENYLYSVHMLQHMIFSYFVPPLRPARDAGVDGAGCSSATAARTGSWGGPLFVAEHSDTFARGTDHRRRSGEARRRQVSQRRP